MSRLQADDTVVIIGAGIIGLSTAFNLARSDEASSLKSKVKIEVIEKSHKPFAAASANCTGCFHYGFPEERLKPLVPLGKHSFELWSKEAEDPAFRAAAGYRSQSSFGILSGTGQGLEKLPGWVQKSSAWDVNTNVLGAHTATVNPAPLGDWLMRQCLDLGVKIRTGFNIVDVQLSDKNQVKGVTCLDESEARISIECAQLVLACGPWTPAIFADLFPASPIHLNGATDAGDWIEFKNPCPVAQNTIAFVSFANLVGDKMEFAGRNDGTIWACGRRNRTADLPAPGQVQAPDEEVVEELRLYAKEYLNWECDCAEAHSELQLLRKGRGFRPATETGLPVISEVPPSALTGDASTEDMISRSTSGVFVCWGHGSYGLTLGMGNGRLMSQIMRGVTPDVDLSLFSWDNHSGDLKSKAQPTEAASGSTAWFSYLFRWSR